MSFKFIMPELGEGLAEGTISAWDVAVGDTVEEDQDLVEIENDKAVTDLPSPVAGTVTKINFGEGETAKVGDVLIVIDDGSPDDDTDDDSAAGDADAAEPAAADEAAETGEQPETPAPTEAPVANHVPQTAGEAAANRVLAMPSVRRLAREKGVDIQTLTPTGSHGHVTRADVEKAAAPAADATTAASGTTGDEAAAAVPAATAAPVAVTDREGDRREAYSGVRAATGRAMATSHATIPPVTNFGEVEVGALLKLRKRYKAAAADQDIHLTVLPFIVKALVAALKKYPVLNSSLDTETDEIVYHSACNVAIATDTDRGLYAPVVKDADRANILEIARAIGDNADKAADGKLSADDMSGASVTVSNLGGVDGGWFTPIITSPQAAILGVGRAVKAPYVNDDGDLAVGQMMKLSLTYDHRIIDGVRGQEILNTVMRLLHDPNLLIIEG
ncbi:dihydrolipoamide acetyltransferase family protein [Corynebacterium nuruki]|uniref:Dihydrolipoamide acetyltransferase component of pyruvate dehydrogenase complex n=1 Tax=Corynebacterium nuruki TaxID=1032851 RepID=A0A3D4T090_9CORY|nr:dihydrolipoamide acetyltransferase family protein [Corynebacterium nuruki]HCT14681.1 2-oxo acid dehydrogenase subunit E2 [Corynebacterium nuruki]